MSDNDGFLHAYEIYNLPLQARLAVLSACETGVGELVKGEGVMSLARAFHYAGCPSVVTSLWKVDDEATAQLMQYFYENLANGKTKSTALREAKLSYLKNAPESKKHPLYWAGFVLIGDDSEIILQESRNGKWLGALGSIVLLSLIVWVARRKLMG